MNSDFGYAAGFLLGNWLENRNYKKNESEYKNYCETRNKLLDSEYETMSLYVDLFTTETANDEIFKITTVHSIGISMVDANFQLMEQAKNISCNTVVAIRYEFQKHEFGELVMASGTISTTDKDVYKEIIEEKRKKLEEIKKIKKQAEEVMKKEHEKEDTEQKLARESVNDLISKFGREFYELITTYTDSGFKVSDPIHEGIVVSLYLDNKEEVIEKSLLGHEKKNIVNTLNRIDIIDNDTSVKLKFYKKHTGQDWKFDHEEIADK